MYPNKSVTLHRVTTMTVQRSQGDGEEQTTPPPLPPPPPPLPLPLPPSVTATTTGADLPDGAESVSTVKEIPRQALTLPKEDTPLPKEVTPLPKEVSPLPKEDTPLPKEVTALPKEVTPLPKEVSPLPKVLDIAYKLTKVSVTTKPDSDLLNVPPKNFLCGQNIIPLYPYKKKERSGSGGDKVFATARPKRREPKFVPYEPYKACVKPILMTTRSKKIQKCPKEKKKEITDKPIGECKEMDNDGDSMKNAEKVSVMVMDFEKERAEWEQKTTKLKAEMTVLENQVTHVKKEKTNLERQLSVQSQINTELKKLLVASVGEDVQGRVQCLTEDKARMATMIRKYSERVDRDYEERERIGIQCDVWRSKFLGSSMLVDELVGLRVGLSQQLKEASEGLRLLLDEHQLARQHVLNMYRMNKQLREAFDPLASASNPPPPLASADLVTLAVDGSGLAETVRDRLLGDLGRAVGDGGGTHTHGLEIYTPGCKIARQLLGQIMSSGGGKTCECSTVSPNRAALVHRYHPNTRIDHLTVNCCAHCNGEIIVV
ncbi:hypothetical protein Pmani_008820 [Petrolisthes manimaculis]|uniref:Golgin-45 n=1 Tax=Petrolisthes manimaculis TaxID=1843537 RepID=A0AAE1UJ59_9EUCA|nr:hypothetical protein Pmani_008820 [Petrolisthes manimaculis]